MWCALNDMICSVVYRMVIFYDVDYTVLFMVDHGGNVKFKSFLATTITAKDLSSISSGDKKSMYMLPEVLHYKKILAASIAGQECAPYEPATNNNINTAINPKHVPKPKVQLHFAVHTE